MAIKRTNKAQEIIKARKDAIEKALPVTVLILGKTFKVKVVNLKGNWGDCNLSELTIRIHQNQTIKQAKETLWHEAIHAALAVSGLNELLEDKSANLEEALVRCIEHAFSDIIDLKKLAKENTLTIDME